MDRRQDTTGSYPNKILQLIFHPARLFILYWLIHSGYADYIINNIFGWDTSPLLLRDYTRIHVILLLGFLGSVKITIYSWFLATTPYSSVVPFLLQIIRGLIECISLTLALQNPHPFSLLSSSFPFFSFEGLAISLCIIGLALELGSEVQRKIWKNQPINKGKPYTQGFTIWNSSIFLASGSLKAALIYATVQSAVFIFFAIPDLQGHNKKKYLRIIKFI